MKQHKLILYRNDHSVTTGVRYLCLMKLLQQLHEEFIEKANRPMRFGALPIAARRAEAPVGPLDRWHEVDGARHKLDRFRVPEHRDEFVIALLAYEHQVQHHAQLALDEGQVNVRVQTRDTERVTSIDKEYARYADLVYKDLVSRPDAVSSSDPDQRFDG